MTEDSLTDVTITNVLTDNLYNDLGFIVNNKLMILIEAQSTWTMNILVRVLLYLAQSYHEYFQRTSQDYYKSKKVKMPIPELYVIYTGNRGKKTDRILLSKEFLAQREKEVVTIMMSLFDEEQVMKSFIRSERHDADRETARRLIKKGKMTLEDIADCVPSLSFDELKEIEAEVMQLV